MSQPAYEVEPLDRVDEDVTGADEIRARRAEVEQTACNVAGTLDAIKDKLDPQVIAETAKQTVHDVTADVKAQAKEAVQEAVHGAREATIGRAQHAVHQVQERVGDAVGTVRETSENIMDTIRENPIPFALIGLGLGWLFVSSRQRSGRWESREYSNYGGTGEMGEFPHYQPSFTAQGGYTGGQYGSFQGGEYPTQTGSAGVREKLGDVAGQVQEKAGEVKDRVQEKAGEVKERVQSTAGQVAETVQERAGEIRQRAGEVMNRAGYQAQRAQYAVQEAVTESPMTVAAVAFGMGALLGLLIPETRAEHRLMGEAKGQVMDRAQTVAQDLGQKAQHVAQQTLEVAKEEAKTAAKDAGLTPQGVGQSVASAAGKGKTGKTQTGTFDPTGMMEDETEDLSTGRLG